MSLRPQFTDEEWRTLEKAPIWAFLVIAAADNKVDPKEVKAFSKELAEAGLYRDELAREVFSSCGTDFADVFQSCLLAPQEALTSLRGAGQLLDRKGGEHAEHFKQAVLMICKNVAEASGGIFGGKISKDEKERMMLIAATLGV
jgi:tellurite resistance protein